MLKSIIVIVWIEIYWNLLTSIFVELTKFGSDEV